MRPFVPKKTAQHGWQWQKLGSFDPKGRFGLDWEIPPKKWALFIIISYHLMWTFQTLWYHYKCQIIPLILSYHHVTGQPCHDQWGLWSDRVCLWGPQVRIGGYEDMRIWGYEDMIIHDICNFYATDNTFGLVFCSTQKSVNCDQTDIASNQRTLQYILFIWHCSTW